MPILSRALMALCLLFWGLLLLGLGDLGTYDSDTILGGILITLIPATLAVLLEIAHHRRRRRAFRDPAPAGFDASRGG